MANAIYNSFFRDVINGSIDLDSDTIKVMLVTDAYTPNVDTHTKRSDITNEVVGTGYTSGGATLANKTVTVDNTANGSVFDADNVVWSTSTITARGCILYKSRGGVASADELICYKDFGANVSSTAANFEIDFGSSGILTFGN